MTFHNVRFPTSISYGAVGGPKFSTTVQTLNSGHEQRNINWADARREYRFDVSPAREQSWKGLLSFFHARRGRAYGFRLKDFADYKLSDEEIGIGDGSRTDFQITKSYGEVAEGYLYSRKITRPVVGSLSVSVDAVEVIGTWNVDYESGLLSFLSPPAEGVVVRVSGEFDVPVRFDTDLMEAAFAGPDIHHWHSVKLVEIKE